jgi:hypothetical protein
MKPLLLSLALLALLCAPASGQTLKTLSYNTTNGQVAYTGTNALTFTNAISFTTNAAATTRTNLGLGSLSFGTFSSATNVALKVNTNLVVTNGAILATNIGSSYIEAQRFFVGDSTNAPIGFEIPGHASKFVRALAGSTNTNEPFSGTLTVDDTALESSVQIVVSNGIILQVIVP